MDMNDAGNFLIETCDETVSRDLKQQLLLLNGRWRELFVKVKHVNISFKQRILHLTYMHLFVFIGARTTTRIYLFISIIFSMQEQMR